MAAGNPLSYRLMALLAVFLLAVQASPARPADGKADTDFTSMSLKELMALEVFTAATMVPTRSSRAPGTVYSFDRDDFTRFGVRRLEDLMQFVPGIQVNQYRKRHTSIWSRGLINRYNDKMILLVDGVPVEHLYYGHFALGDNLPLEQIDKVEIIMGPASSLYGANAFAGIIAVTTRDFADSPEISVTVEAGNHQRRKVSGLYNSGRLQAFASTLHQDAPFRDDRRSFIGGPVFQPPDEDYTALHLKARPVAGLTLRLDYTEENTPFLFIPDTQDAFVEGSRLGLSARYEAGNLDEGRIEATAWHSIDEGREFELERISRRQAYRENQDATLSGLSLTGLRRVGDHTLALGLSGRRDRVTDTGYIRYFRFDQGFLPTPEAGNLLADDEPHTTDYAVFLQDVWRLTPHLEITLGARQDHFDWFGDHLNYRGAAVYTPNDRQTWKLMYGTAIRTPSLREYMKNLESAFVPPAPEPEELRSLELGYQHQWQEASLQLTLYRNKVEQFIVETPTPDGADEYFANLADTWTLSGAEAILAWRPGTRIGARLALSYLEVRGSRTDDVPYLANWNGSLHIDYQLADLHQASLSFIHTGDRPDTNSFTTDNPQAGVIANLSLSGSLGEAAGYTLGVTNIADKRLYHPAADFGGQHNTENRGREIWLKLHWNLPF